MIERYALERGAGQVLHFQDHSPFGREPLNDCLDLANGISYG
ncbi:MAG TPA: hypothetical protein VNI54_15195 [Thermoanaerobaculia bacterium]|nr:hypothetical protein [Thermoanaerobaculia bacterium]